MKRTLLLSVIMFFITRFLFAQIAVNTDGSDPHPSAMLQVSSDSKGFLPPQMIILQRDQIQNPAAGLMIFNSDHRCVNFFDGTDWIELGLNPNVPVAELYGSDPQGDAPKEIYFNDLSSGDPTSWLWNFGDGGTSTERNPIYTYNTPGFYNVTLTVTNEYGTDTRVEVDYVTISGPGDGVPCSGTARIMDADFNEYLTVQIGDQCWMRENLKVTKYPDGTAIPNVTDNGEWAALADNDTDDAYCFYDNNTNSEYGALYTYAAAIADNWEKDNAEGQGLCPDGWHLPTSTEWFDLQHYLVNNGYNYDESVAWPNDKLGKSMASTSGWKSSVVAGDVGNDQGSNNSCAFSGFPESSRIANGSFNVIEEYVNWWTATEFLGSTTSVRLQRLQYNQDCLADIATNKSNGNSIRCIKN